MRSGGPKKLPSLSLVKWIFLVTGFVAFVLVSFFLYVRSSDSEYRNAENNAIRIAKEQGGLTSISDAASHTWDETVWVVSGKDADGEPWMIFERANEIVREKMSENLSRKQMLAQFGLEHEGTPIRIIPGWFKDAPAWEIRYWTGTDKQRQSLDFYSLENGTLLKTFVLSS
ncbi:hypothetical protein D7Z26_03240 [Cohnella endophytica]|uniref:Cell wall elongation regulator TseB-like domain-containing protein n=1 Tax=Cohnella endophytica TaxID=2419778 RepID=A0A494Y2P5_9BACL|nr:DUF5590 domain-containing protein [Cohnella endophytica]RKP57016.1 hypothetical protein D7Z26_03240 [Cohnella endophytica]